MKLHNDENATETRKQINKIKNTTTFNYYSRTIFEQFTVVVVKKKFVLTLDKGRDKSRSRNSFRKPAT